MPELVLRHPATRMLVVTASFLAMELFRQLAYVHSWLSRCLMEAGVENFSADLFEASAATAEIWLLWSGAVVACFLIVSDLYRNAYGPSWSAVLRAGTFVWVATFGVTWLSFLACGLVHVDLVFAALAGAWVEALLLAAIAVRWPIDDPMSA